VLALVRCAAGGYGLWLGPHPASQRHPVTELTLAAMLKEAGYRLQTKRTTNFQVSFNIRRYRVRRGFYMCSDFE
jgi:hypothetical protein